MFSHHIPPPQNGVGSETRFQNWPDTKDLGQARGKKKTKHILTLAFHWEMFIFKQQDQFC